MGRMRFIPIAVAALSMFAPTGAAESVLFREVMLDTKDAVTEKSTLQTIADEFLDQPLTMPVIEQLSASLRQFLEQQGYLAVSVLAPAGQDVTDGELVLQVRVGRVGTISVEGVAHFDADRLRQQLGLNADEPLTRSDVRESIAWLNRNPYRDVSIELSQGSDDGQTDVTLRVEDRVPFRFFLSADNHGTAQVGRHRMTAGFEWGNAFGRDHRLGYYASRSGSAVTSHSLSYRVPLPTRHEVLVRASYVESDPDVDAAGFDLEGRSTHVSMAYNVPFLRDTGIAQSLSAYVEYRRSNNQLAFGGIDVLGSYTDIYQMGVEYERTFQAGCTGVDLRARWNVSPGNLGGDNTDAAFGASRAGAASSYQYAEFSVAATTFLTSRLRLENEFRAQYSNDNLVGSEQFGLGGAHSIRGFEAFAATGDRGFSWRTEAVWSARTPVGEFSPKLFVDYGEVDYANPLPGEHRASLASVGLGVDYRLSRSVSLKLEYGHGLQGADAMARHRLHGSLGITF